MQDGVTIDKLYMLEHTWQEGKAQAALKVHDFS